MPYFCNPLNLPYKYQFLPQKGGVTASREAADPSLAFFKGLYYLFPSMTAGFYTSEDMATWTFRPFLQDMPVTDYAPDARPVGEYLYVCASNAARNGIFFRSKNPLTEPFEVIPADFLFWDPALFEDEDGRLYFYWGCSNSAPIYGVEMDRDTLRPRTAPVPLIAGQPDKNGFERVGDDHKNAPPAAPYIEGAWMNKHQGRYYLQYAAPGTEFNGYCDAAYVADAPLGAFRETRSAPFSYQPGGFLTGAGHGSTLCDKNGAWWHAATARISVNHMFERRLGLWRAGFDADGELFCDQRFGDWVRDTDAPPWSPPAWMLLSYGKPVRASSGERAEAAADENIRTWWSAGTDAPGEWILLDLTRVCDVRAVQINFADEGLMSPDQTLTERKIDTGARVTRWLLEGSENGENWLTIEDKRAARTDLPHDLIVREEGIACRYLKLTVCELPFDQTARVSGLRVFGLSAGEQPGRAKATVRRVGAMDARVRWRAENAVGANILWGEQPDKLYHSYLTYGKTEQIIGALRRGAGAFFRVDTFNEHGITEGAVIALAPEENA